MDSVKEGAAALLGAQLRGSAVPVIVTFQVTDRCNYDCVHCYQEHTDRDELSFDEIARILEEMAEAGVLFLTLMGGEFFMRPDADRILSRAHDLGFAIKLLTTGHHVHERRADFLATVRPLHVDLSLYAARASVHEAVTLQRGSWDRTVAAARRLVEREIPVHLKAPMMEVNAAEVRGLRLLAEEIGAEFSCDPKITGMENSDQSPVALRMSAKTLASFYADRDAGFGSDLERYYAGRLPTTAHRPLDQTPCQAGQQSCSITPQGKVWPCNSLPWEVGDLRRQRFADVWNGSEQLREVRGLHWAEISECNRCELRGFCSRCHGMALLEQGEVRGPSLEACRHAVALRDALRGMGVVPESHTALPPTWDRVDPDGQHHLGHRSKTAVRSQRLRVV